MLTAEDCRRRAASFRGAALCTLLCKLLPLDGFSRARTRYALPHDALQYFLLQCSIFT